MSYPAEASSEADHANAAGALLGLSPLLVMGTSVVDALALAISALAALVAAGCLSALIRDRMTEAARFPAAMLAIGLCTSTVMLLLQAFAFDLYQRVAFMVPITITNWLVLVRLDRASTGGAAIISDANAALRAAAALVIVGAVCEAVGHGSLLAGIEAFFMTNAVQIKVVDSAFLLAAMPPGAFIIAGLLLAARNAYRLRT